jgi:PatG Domain
MENSSDSANGAFVYVIGRIQPHFPNLSVKKECYQSTGLKETVNQTDYELIRAALSQKQNRYLLRKICWVLLVEGIETYIVRPSDPIGFDILAESLRTTYNGIDRDVVIGTRGPTAPPEICNGLVVPIVTFEQIHSLDIATLIKGVRKNKKGKYKKGYNYTSPEQPLYTFMQIADNAGTADEHRCLNYLLDKYPRYYERTLEMDGKGYSLTKVEVRPSRLSGAHKILDCIFSYTNRKTSITERWFCRADITEMFPFIVSEMSPYYDR